MLRRVFGVVLAIGLTACGGSSTDSGTAPTPGGGSPTSPGGGNPAPAGTWVLVSHPDYQWGEVPPSEVPWANMTHLVLNFLEPAGRDGSYHLEVTGYGPPDLASWSAAAAQYIEAAHAQGVQVLCDLGGEGFGGAVFNEAISNGHSDALAVAIVDTLRAIGFDGVDLDWEEDVRADGVVILLQSLRRAWPEGIVTVAVEPAYGDDQVAFANTVAAAQADVDAVMVMSFGPPDQTWTWWVVPVPVTPLHGSSTPWGDPAQPYSLDRELAVWTAAGVPASKLIMGVAGFGLVWADTNGDGVAPVSPYSNYDALANDPSCSNPPWTCAAPAHTEVAPVPCTDNSVTQAWVEQAISIGGSRWELRNDDVGEVTYWGAPAPDNLVSVPSPCGGGDVAAGLILYETPDSMASKVSYITRNGLLGLEFWTLSQMRSSSGGYPNLEAVKR